MKNEKIKYVADVLKNLSIILIVGAFIGKIIADVSLLSVLIWILYGIILLIEGYILIKDEGS